MLNLSHIVQVKSVRGQEDVTEIVLSDGAVLRINGSYRQVSYEIYKLGNLS